MAYNQPLKDPNMFLIMYYYNILWHKYYLKHIRFYIAIGLALGLNNMFVTTVVL